MNSETPEQPKPDQAEASARDTSADPSEPNEAQTAAPPAVDKPAVPFQPDESETAIVAEQAEEMLEDEPIEPEEADDLTDDKASAHEGPAVSIAGRRVAIGVDIGGSGIKAAAVDLDTGQLLSQRHRVPTPQPSAPAAIIASVARLIKRIGKEVELAADTAVGVGFPGVITSGVTRTAANVDPGWLDFDADAAMERVLRRPVHLINDADAAGVAEMRFGAGVGRRGTVFLITLGTGTGSALFYNGTLVPNLELGHMEIRGRDAERRSAAAARIRRGISWKAWASDLDEHLLAIEKLFWPQLFIIGGGVSKRSERFIPRLTVRAEVIPAKLLNDAGIVGAAMAADEREHMAE
jgi:polyphosphate glucokinase